LIHKEFYQIFVTSGGSCLFIFLVNFDLIILYSGHINSIFCETALNIRLGFISKGIELFLIFSLILCFVIDTDASNSFSRLLYKKISFLSFKIMKDLHLFKVAFSVIYIL